MTKLTMMFVVFGWGMNNKTLMGVKPLTLIELALVSWFVLGFVGMWISARK